MPSIDRARPLAGISSDAVKRATGKSWDQWLKTLDADGAPDMTHKQIAAHLRKRRGVQPWWSQMVTVGYEQARGRRVKHQKTDGFSISASRTMDIPISELYRWWTDPKRRGRWLSDTFSLRRATRNKSLRVTWPDGTRVDVDFLSKGAEKSTVQVEHSKLPSAASAARAKAAWRARLDAMARVAAEPSSRPSPRRKAGAKRRSRAASARAARVQ